jgi:hypothetical protein
VQERRAPQQRNRRGEELLVHLGGALNRLPTRAVPSPPKPYHATRLITPLLQMTVGSTHEKRTTR